MRVSKTGSDLIDELYEKKTLNINWEEVLQNVQEEPYINSYFNLRSLSNSAVVRYKNKDQFVLVNPKISIDNIKSKDVDQLSLLDSLRIEDIKILVVTGPAGSGKTFLSLAWAIFEILSIKDKKLLLTKATETVKSSKFFGAVPGGVDEKFAIFLDSYKLAIQKILKGDMYSDMLTKTNKIEYKPIEFCRGDSRDNTILIVDEAQNLTWHETKTLLTRLGENSKAILLGDTSQKDVNKNDKCGVELLVNNERFMDSSLTSHIKLFEDYRGPISKLISQIAEDIE